MRHQSPGVNRRNSSNAVSYGNNDPEMGGIGSIGTSNSSGGGGGELRGDVSKGKSYHRPPIRLPFDTRKCMGFILGVGLLLLLLLPRTVYPMVLVMCTVMGGAVFAQYLCDAVMSMDDGTQEMRAVADPIREGAEGFLKVQYTAIAKIASVVMTFIVLSFVLRPESKSNHVTALGNTQMGLLGGWSFLIGAACSAVAGYVSMWVSAHTNIRVASSARYSYAEALVVCFRGGAFSAVLDITLCVAGVASLFVSLYVWYVWRGVLESTDIPVLMVGYGFGASFVALFMQLGGGIYTKAADVGADLVGKVENSIPEDDPRNPATIADLVGDMVGDCCGSSADVFESIAAEMIGAMILGSTLAREIGLESPLGLMLFPVCVHAMDLIVSGIGIYVVGRGHGGGGGGGGAGGAGGVAGGGGGGGADPMEQLTRGYRVACGCGFAGFVGLTKWLLDVPGVPGAWKNFAGCGLAGMVTAYIIILSTQYYTDYKYWPVQSIAEASTTGHGTNIITGVAVGMKSTVVPCLTVSVGVLVAYHLGRTSGVGSGHNAGLFGTAVATMGMLSCAVFVLSMNNFGPIADNAGGIAEMSQQPEGVRDITDRLDAAGNVTKAITKGYSIASASLACFLLFGAFMDEFSEFTGEPFKHVDIAVPEILIGGLLGVMMIFWFTGLAVAAVGKTAGEVVVEVRRQFKEYPGILTFESKPDYRKCVELVTQAALKEMRFPGVLCVAMPVATGLTFRVVGAHTDRPMLGAQCLASYLMFATVSGIMMALFMDNVGGAWDNAKKWVELGHYGGKGSEAHKAAITGDTVGDPFKDTAGPSLHVVIKLLSTTVLVLGPIFIN